MYKKIKRTKRYNNNTIIRKRNFILSNNLEKKLEDINKGKNKMKKKMTRKEKNSK